MDSKTLDLVNKTIPEFNNELAERSQEKENALRVVDIQFNGTTEIGLGETCYAEEMTKRCRREKEEHFLKENMERIIDGDFRGSKRYRRRQVLLRNSHYTKALIRKDECVLSSAVRRGPLASTILYEVLAGMFFRAIERDMHVSLIRHIPSPKDS